MITYHIWKNYNSDNIRKSPFLPIKRKRPEEVPIIHTATTRSAADHTLQEVP